MCQESPLPQPLSRKRERGAVRVAWRSRVGCARPGRPRDTLRINTARSPDEIREAGVEHSPGFHPGYEASQCSVSILRLLVLPGWPKGSPAVITTVSPRWAMPWAWAISSAVLVTSSTLRRRSLTTE